MRSQSLLSGVCANTPEDTLEKHGSHQKIRLSHEQHLLFTLVANGTDMKSPNLDSREQITSTLVSAMHVEV